MTRQGRAIVLRYPDPSRAITTPVPPLGLRFDPATKSSHWIKP